MRVNHVYYSMVPIGTHAGLFGMTAHLSAGKPESSDEVQGLLSGLNDFKSKQHNILFLTLDYVNPPTELELGEFIDQIRRTHTNAFIIIKGRFLRVPKWFHRAHWIIQEINLADWKGLPCNELHAIISDPMEDPVVTMGNTALYLVPTERTDYQIMFDFVKKSSNPWKFGVPPSKLIKVKKV